MYTIDPTLAKISFMFALTYTAVALVGYFMNTNERRRLIGVVLGFVAIVSIYFIFVPFSGLQSFGPSPIALVAMMILAIILGSLAEYFFSLDTEFNWLDMIRPILISPLLLLPLVGLLQKSEALDLLATVSLLLVAFQNGFFWREMIKKLRAAI